MHFFLAMSKALGRLGSRTAQYTRDGHLVGLEITIRVTIRSLFHRLTRSAYLYNGCLPWYNVVLTSRVHSSVKYSQQSAAVSCDGEISMLTTASLNNSLIPLQPVV